MDAQQALLPVVHSMLAEEMGYRTGNVRLANLL
jgi:hypothetical protein